MAGKQYRVYCLELVTTVRRRRISGSVHAAQGEFRLKPQQALSSCTTPVISFVKSLNSELLYRCLYYIMWFCEGARLNPTLGSPCTSRRANEGVVDEKFILAVACRTSAHQCRSLVVSLVSQLEENIHCGKLNIYSLSSFRYCQ